MARTADRPIPGGRVRPRAALIVRHRCSRCSASSLLAATVNVLAAALSLCGFVGYVGVYTIWLKRRTPQNIVIGGAAGAVPPLVGWAAATGHVELDRGAAVRDRLLLDAAALLGAEPADEGRVREGKTAIIDGAINGMIDALGDPYSDYLNEKEARQLNESISSSFEGIGAEIQEKDGFITVVSPIKNSPAERAGILPNDKIIAVDGDSIQGMSSSEAVLLIRGEKGTLVTLTIMRGEAIEPIEIKITRDVIPIETVYSEMLEDDIAHIRITSFSSGTYKELLLALDEMEEARNERPYR